MQDPSGEERGYLSRYFSGIVAKRLSLAESLPTSSYQHELSGVPELVTFFGKEKITNATAFFASIDRKGQAFSEETPVKWYDLQEHDPTRSEYRFHFRSSWGMERISAGDLLIIARRPTGDLIIIVTARYTTEENQIMWVFGISDQVKRSDASAHDEEEGTPFILRNIGIDDDPSVSFVVDSVLEQYGIVIEDPHDEYLDALLATILRRCVETDKLS